MHRHLSDDRLLDGYDYSSSYCINSLTLKNFLGSWTRVERHGQRVTLTLLNRGLCHAISFVGSLVSTVSVFRPVKKSMYASLRPLAKPARSCNRPKAKPLYSPIRAVRAAVGIGSLSTPLSVLDLYMEPREEAHTPKAPDPSEGQGSSRCG